MATEVKETTAATGDERLEETMRYPTPYERATTTFEWAMRDDTNDERVAALLAVATAVEHVAAQLRDR